MDRLKGIGSFLIIIVVLFVFLRLLHLTVPIFYPRVLTGPFSVDDVGSTPEYLGFSPLLPFYRPEQLGVRPVNITVTRRPHPKVVIFWQAEHFLYLAERQGGETPRHDAGDGPLPGHPDSAWWLDGRTHHVVMKQNDLWIELRTDLSLRDVQRIVDTLLPYEELR